MLSPDVVVVGAGVSGLACALTLQQAGRPALVLEASDEVGGRVRSHKYGDFVLDRGFQVLLTAYPTCRALLDYDALRLGHFYPGALVRLAGGDVSIGDPLRRIRDLVPTLRAPIGTFRDKVLVGKLSIQMRSAKPESVWNAPNIPTLAWLRDYGFSDRIIESFFRPFLSGIFLEKELATSARMFQFVFRFFSLGSAALPAGGMGAIPRQMAARIPSGQIRLHTRVAGVKPGLVTTEDGREIAARHVVIATDGEQARRWIPSLSERSWHGGTCYYFDAPSSPFSGRRRKLWLNATGEGRINHIAVPSDVAAGYAPPGRSLVSVNTVGDAAQPAGEDEIKSGLARLFGEKIMHWKFLRKYPVPRSLPQFDPADAEAWARPLDLPAGLHLCGDVRAAGSLETAMASGVAAAKACLVS